MPHATWGPAPACWCPDTPAGVRIRPQSVAYLHNLSLVHTDLKPENILLVNNQYKKLNNNKCACLGPTLLALPCLTRASLDVSPRGTASRLSRCRCLRRWSGWASAYRR